MSAFQAQKNPHSAGVVGSKTRPLKAVVAFPPKRVNLLSTDFHRRYANLAHGCGWEPWVDRCVGGVPDSIGRGGCQCSWQNNRTAAFIGQELDAACLVSAQWWPPGLDKFKLSSPHPVGQHRRVPVRGFATQQQENKADADRMPFHLLQCPHSTHLRGCPPPTAGETENIGHRAPAVCCFL